jgi:predicted nucleotidyltransferase
MTKLDKIICTLKLVNEKYKNEGFKIVSLFGSYANGTNDIFSDIDLTYNIDHNIFYKDNAFAKLSKIQEIKDELRKKFHTEIDLIPINTNNLYLQKSLQDEQVFI